MITVAVALHLLSLSPYSLGDVSMNQTACREIFNYEDGGFLSWRNHPKCKWLNGRKVGTTSKRDGYRRVCYMGNMWLEHKLIFLHQNGVVPEFIDHINRVRDDNRIENLRKASKVENGINKGVQSNNKTGVPGVCLDNACGLWKVQLTKAGKRLCNRTFREFDDAVAYRKEMERVHFGEWAPW